MKKGKGQGPDDIPVEAWIALGNKGVEFLVNFFNRLLRGEKIPDEWRRSVLVPLYKGKGDIKKCGNYQWIKLMSHTMKLWERIIEARIRKEVNSMNVFNERLTWKEHIAMLISKLKSSLYAVM